MTLFARVRPRPVGRSTWWLRPIAWLAPALTLGAIGACASRAPAAAAVAVPERADRPSPAAALDVSADAWRLHREAIVVDTHVDTTQRLLFDAAFDLGVRHADGHLDIPRMRDGGLDAAFFSIWVPASVPAPDAVRRALALVDRTRETVRTHARDLELATSAAGVREAVRRGKIAVLLGLEGGHMIDGDLGLLRTFAALGVRYLTLTHSAGTPWAGSSGDAAPRGLTPFGRDVVRELNRLGVMVDVSHVSDETFYDVIATTQAPVLASHSSARALVNHARNMTDDMLRAVAKNGGVVMVDFVVTFLDERYRQAFAAMPPAVASRVRDLAQRCGADEACSLVGANQMIHELMAAGALPPVSWTAIVDHLDHIVKTAGIDHVGIGSDFDGATTPLGMEDVTKLPRLTDALLRRGYAPEAIRKILGGNVLRVMADVDAIGRRSSER
ncbi:MAG: dipeptidase [Acidobacteria bacterium]|nr:dipeptidase [Acidobacteriota bacterium]